MKFFSNLLEGTYRKSKSSFVSAAFIMVLILALSLRATIGKTIGNAKIPSSKKAHTQTFCYATFSHDHRCNWSRAPAYVET